MEAGVEEVLDLESLHFSLQYCNVSIDKIIQEDSKLYKLGRSIKRTAHPTIALLTCSEGATAFQLNCDSVNEPTTPVQLQFVGPAPLKKHLLMLEPSPERGK